MFLFRSKLKWKSKKRKIKKKENEKKKKNLTFTRVGSRCSPKRADSKSRFLRKRHITACRHLLYTYRLVHKYEGFIYLKWPAECMLMFLTMLLKNNNNTKVFNRNITMCNVTSMNANINILSLRIKNIQTVVSQRL